MSERNEEMANVTKEENKCFSTIECDFLSLMCDSTTGQQICEDHQFSGESVIEDDDLYEEFHGTTNGALSDKGINRLSDTFDSIGLVEKIQKDNIRYEEFETSDGFGTDMDGTAVRCRGPCIDVNKVYRKDNDGDTLLHIAIIILAEDLAFYFIDRTPWFTWLNIQNMLLQTPLHLAVLTNQVSLVRRLVVAGADTESRDKEGNMAIHLACRDNLVNILRSLLEPISAEEQKRNNYDASVQNIPHNLNSKNYEGHTCLHIASSFNHMDIVKTLIDNNANINARAEKSGRTILHEAAWSGKINMVKYLISLGKRCEINAVTYDGYTAFDLARSRGHWSIVIELATAVVENGDEEMEQ